jgi:glutamate/tyrosine decarboxylase-like PLP-dependent enzyme
MPAKKAGSDQGRSPALAQRTSRDRALRDASRRSRRYLRNLPRGRVAPTAEAIRSLRTLGGPLPMGPMEPMEVIRQLDEVGSPATVATAGGRYFGFVIGSAVPAAVAANWLAGAWNQNAAFHVLSPTASRLEAISLGWIREMLRLPKGAEGAFVSGDTMANFTGLAAARHAILSRAGWDVEERGLPGAPRIDVIVSEEVHVSVLKALSMLGLGRGNVVRLPTDGQGRIKADALPGLRGPSIICVQAGNVNSGAFDPIGDICEQAKASNAWVHVDGAFGLWSAVAPSRRHLSRGANLAHSWALDGHKWLNVPYDSGIVFVREPGDLRAAMSVGPAAYLKSGEEREPSHYTPELSRRARGVEAWAAIRSLGREGVAEVIERSCRMANRFADGLRTAGWEVLNDVVLNQVLVAFVDDAITTRVIERVQADGTCWCGGTEWKGRAAMRISVSSWATTFDDVDRSLKAILRIAAGEAGRRGAADRR